MKKSIKFAPVRTAPLPPPPPAPPPVKVIPVPVVVVPTPPPVVVATVAKPTALQRTPSSSVLPPPVALPPLPTPSSLADSMLKSLMRDTVKHPPGVVRHTDGTIEPTRAFTTEERQQAPDVDALFGASPTYRVIQKEKTEHRLMLWLKLQGHSNTEVCRILGYTASAVSQITRQPWFMDAFCRMSSEIGKDAAQTLLEGEVIASVQQLAKLRDSGETDAVKLAATNSILDRVRGKATQQVEVKNNTNVQVTVFDAAKLLEEQKRNAEILRGRGLN